MAKSRLVLEIVSIECSWKKERRKKEKDACLLEHRKTEQNKLNSPIFADSMREKRITEKVSSLLVIQENAREIDEVLSLYYSMRERLCVSC